MKILYTDASFDWTVTESNGENVVRGKIAIADGVGFERIEKVVVGKVDGLKQYINVFELTAIARAIELANEYLKEESADALEVWTDSKTAMIWASSGKVGKKVKTVAHENALEYLARVRALFGGVVTFHFVPRERNPAGKLLELELEREAPHTK
jgi:ribonuclease HI